MLAAEKIDFLRITLAICSCIRACKIQIKKQTQLKTDIVAFQKWFLFNLRPKMFIKRNFYPMKAAYINDFYS